MVRHFQHIHSLSRQLAGKVGGRMAATAAGILFLMTAALPAATAAAPARSADRQKTYDLDWDVSLYGAGATQRALPFWAVTNKLGIVPNTHSGFMTGGFDFKYTSRHAVNVYAGVKLTGALVPIGLSDVTSVPAVVGYGDLRGPKASSVASGMVNDLYVGVGWKFLRLDVGMIDRKQDYNGLSLTGGDLMWTGNTRAVPGYNLQLDYVAIPGTKGIFSVKANYSDYKMLDNRYVEGPMLHNKALYFKFKLHRKVFLQLGLEQFSLWGGTSPRYGKQPQSFKDYVRVVCGMSGGSGATTSDQINVLGDHRGRELIQVDWHADKFKMSFAHDIPFDDGSGMGFQNFPDGVNTISFSFNDRDKWVTDILYEFASTRCQSGNRHSRPAKPDELEKNPDIPEYTVGGNDNYFNNGEYRSAWTYYGKVIGLPLFVPVPVNADGETWGVSSNRVVAHHLGIAGKFAHKVPYRFKATYSKNVGKHSQSYKFFDEDPQQVSLALEVTSPKISRHFPVNVSLGLYGDVGKLYRNNFGLTLRLSYNGSWNRSR